MHPSIRMYTLYIQHRFVQSPSALLASRCRTGRSRTNTYICIYMLCMQAVSKPWENTVHTHIHTSIHTYIAYGTYMLYIHKRFPQQRKDHWLAFAARSHPVGSAIEQRSSSARTTRRGGPGAPIRVPLLLTLGAWSAAGGGVALLVLVWDER